MRPCRARARSPVTRPSLKIGRRSTSASRRAARLLTRSCSARFPRWRAFYGVRCGSVAARGATVSRTRRPASVATTGRALPKLQLCGATAAFLRAQALWRVESYYARRARKRNAAASRTRVAQMHTKVVSRWHPRGSASSQARRRGSRRGLRAPQHCSSSSNRPLAVGHLQIARGRKPARRAVRAPYKRSGAQGVKDGSADSAVSTRVHPHAAIPGLTKASST